MNNTRWMIFSLLISLALNLLLIGIFIGGLVAKKPNIKPLPTNLGWMTQHLDSASLKSLRPQIEAHARREAPIREKMNRKQREFSKLLSQSNPNDKALAQTLLQLRNHSDEYQKEMHSMILTLIPRLGEEQRRKVIKMLRRPPKGSLKNRNG